LNRGEDDRRMSLAMGGQTIRPRSSVDLNPTLIQNSLMKQNSDSCTLEFSPVSIFEFSLCVTKLVRQPVLMSISLPRRLLTFRSS